LSFDKRINKIFSILNCSNAEISKASGIDASIVSRFRTGARIPRASSLQFLKLCGGIVSYARENCLWEDLKEACGLAGSGKPEDKIYAYLISQSGKTRSKRLDSKPDQRTTYFCGEKLNVIMNMLDISNIRLARVLNVDSSLISRFRNGLRTPSRNSQLVVNLCTYFYKRVLAGGFEGEFADMLGISKSMLVNGGEQSVLHLADWLFDQVETQNTNAIDSFLEKLNSFTANRNLQLPDVDTIINSGILDESITEYAGIDGFRRAVIRFLSSVLISNQPLNLKLYSDQNMDWLSTDAVFLQKWSALMYAILLKKNHIQIIHNIDRRLPEMLVAVEKWIPLYMTGMIKSFYCKRTGDGRFAHTLFIAPQLAAINAHLVIGTESSGKYQYISKEDSISYYETQFNVLRNLSKPLVEVFNEKNLKEYHYRMGEMAMKKGKTKKLLLSLSMATMPEALLKKILIRNKIDHQEIEKILMMHDICIKQFKNELQNGSVIEYVALASDEALYAGKVNLNLSNLFLSQSITYTFEEYSEHILAILYLLRENANYNLVLLQENPFAYIQMTVKSNVGAMVLKSDAPTAAFGFGHPMMCQAFNEYLNAISEKSIITADNRNSLYNQLNYYNGSH